MLDKLKKRKPTQLDLEISELKCELERCKFLLNRNDTAFNMTTDENLLAAQIYERKSLHCHYNYLIEQLRQKEGTQTTKETIAAGEM